MERMWRFVLVALALQVVMVIAGHFNGGVRALSGVFGTAIPLVVAWFYAARGRPTFGEASLAGVAIGAVGAVLGILLAIALGDQPWSLLPIGGASAAFTGWLGAAVGLVVRRRLARGSAAEDSGG